MFLNVSTFLGALAKFGKANISFILSVRPYGTTGRVLMKFYI
jgi:hypothetical protein